MDHRTTLVAEVARRIRDMIRSGELQPGQVLPTQKELASQFQVGFSTIREATQILASSGLIQSRPGKGSWISEDVSDALLSLESAEVRLGDLEIREAQESRALVEGGVVRLAAQRATPEDLERILGALGSMRESMYDDEGFASADAQFHMMVAKAAHNKLLEQFYSLSVKLFSELFSKAMVVPEGKLWANKEEVLARNEALFNAIRAHNPSLARRITADIMKDGSLSSGMIPTAHCRLGISQCVVWKPKKYRTSSRFHTTRQSIPCCAINCLARLILRSYSS